MRGIRGFVVGTVVAAAAVAGCTSTDAVSGASDEVSSAAPSDGGAVVDALESSIEARAADDGAEVDIDIDADGDAGIPESWPEQVPVPDGDVLLAIETDGGHSAATRAPSADVAQSYVDSLVDRGFTLVSESPMDDGGFRLLEGDGLSVAVSWTGGDDVLLSVDIRPAQ